MPEYLAPGVYVEETSYRAKSIEGVATSTAGFVGHTSYGPIMGTPSVITSYEEYKRTYGDVDDLVFSGGNTRTNYMAHAVQRFFENGGKRVYISRLFEPAAGETVASSTAAQTTPYLSGSGDAAFKARYPGLAGNVRVRVVGTRSANVLIGSGAAKKLVGVRHGDMVEINSALKDRMVDAAGADALTKDDVRWVEIDDTGKAWVVDDAAPSTRIDPAGLGGVVQKVSVTLQVGQSPARVDVYGDLSTSPLSQAFVGTVMRTEDPTNGISAPFDRAARVWFDKGTMTDEQAVDLLDEMLAGAPFSLDGGTDGDPIPGETNFKGSGTGHSATGLAALAEVEDIAIVAGPDVAAHSDAGVQQSLRNALISHCENLQYRMCILSADRTADDTAIRSIRGQHDSSYAALYFPWVVVPDPHSRSGGTIEVPPDGFVAGIYARNDIERGVHKAPANEVVRGALRFSRHVDKGTQETLNPEGINCLRFFDGRGYLLWGARTMSSDPEWKYVNVRRLFIFLEHSIDRNTQWAVFEPNNRELWVRVRMTIESFLTDTWRTGALMGDSVKEAFFVRCDRTTMTQGDLDNGRLVCLIGVAPTKPAEFVIFRIGQWTAEASII